MSSAASSSKLTPTTEQLSAADPARSVWVMANAGSGKTHVLVNRVVRLLLAGNAPQSILCLTFTRAAAAEMSLRLYRLLAGWIALDDAALATALEQLGVTKPGPADLARARRLFAIAIETPGGLKIQTIHAFCEMLLHLFPAESGLAPGFSVMDDIERKALLEEARDRALKDASAGDDLALIDGGLVTAENFEALCKAFLPETSIFNGTMHLDNDTIDAGLRRAALVHDYASTDEILLEAAQFDVSRVHEAAQAFAATPPFGSYKYDIHAVLRAIATASSFQDKIASLHALAFTKDFSPRGSFFSKDTRTTFPDLCAWIETWKADIVALSEKHAISRKIDATMDLLRLMRRIDHVFRRLKRERGLYDFDDLIMRTERLLNSAGAAQWVLFKLDANLSHILVDEAQDTSPAQWRIIRALSEEFFAGEGARQGGPRTIFVVGDIKQSIYSFQGADTDAFTAARNFFRDRIGASGKPLVEIDLKISYRTLPAVLQMVDAVFDPRAPAHRGLQQDARDGGHSANRSDGGLGSFELWPLFAPPDKPEPEAWDAPVDRKAADSPRQLLARYIAERVSSWIGKRLLPSKNRPVQAGDILILLQRRGALFDALLAALRAANIPVAGADRLKLQESLAVKDLMALAQACLLPADDLSLACVLKSPLVPAALSEDELLSLAAERKGSLRAALDEGGKHPETLRFLREAEARARDAGPHAFLSAVMTQARGRIAARLGDEALDATAMLIDAALAFERERGTSLAAFLHWFMARDEDLKRELEGTAGEVRIMTVHGAKGLEGNIVILPDAADLPGQRGGLPLLAVPGGGNSPDVLPFFDAPGDIKPAKVKEWKDTVADKSLDERKRLLYVAMTRARDELYVGGALGQKKLPDDSWYSLVEKGLELAEEKHPLRSIEGLHPAGDIRRWGDNPQDATSASLDEKSPPITVPAWALAPAPADGSRVTWDSVTRVAARTSMVFDREAARQGSALHRVLELTHGGDTEEMIAHRLERQKLDPALAAPLHALITAADTASYFAADSRAEVAIAGAPEGLGRVQGRLDRLRITPDALWLLDFKTGRRGGPAHESHIRQMAQYAALLAQAFPGRKLNAALLWTQDMHLESLAESILSQALERLRQERAEGVT